MQLSCLLVVALAVVSVSAAPQHRPPAIPLPDRLPFFGRIDTVDQFGQYAYRFLTHEGLEVTDQGTLQPGPEGNVLVRQGTFSYFAPDGTHISTSYIADELGARFEGAHIPVPVKAIH